jgi:hypothetical protein
MIKFLSIIACLSFDQSEPGLPGIYFNHSQVCSFLQAIDKKWTLELKKNSSFVYTIHEYSTKKNKDSIYKATGSWRISHDTITLYTYVAPYKYQFVTRPDTLLPIGERAQYSGGFVMKLNYLSKIADN